MQVPLIGGYILSVVLNKGPYSTCLNPHIGICRPQRGGLMLRFPRHWVFDIELDRAKRRLMRERRRAWVGTRRVFAFPSNWRWTIVSMYEHGDGKRLSRAIYARVPFYWTWRWVVSLGA